MARRSRYSPEVKERAVRMVFDQQAQHESQWSAISSIASKIDCTRETLRTWVRRAERDAGKRAGLTTDERQRLKELERENRELKRANEILLKDSRRMERTNLSAYAFRFGLLAGRRRGFTPESLNSPRTASVNSGSRSWMRYRLPRRKPSHIVREVSCHLFHPLPVLCQNSALLKDHGCNLIYRKIKI